MRHVNWERSCQGRNPDAINLVSELISVRCALLSRSYELQQWICKAIIVSMSASMHYYLVISIDKLVMRLFAAPVLEGLVGADFTPDLYLFDLIT